MKILFRRILFFIVVIPFFAFGQRETTTQPTSSFDSKIFTGGNFGLQFGTFTLIQVSPMVGYKVTDRFTPGITATYIYENYAGLSGVAPRYTNTIYGGSVFMRYYILPQVFAHVEYQVLNLEVPSQINSYYYFDNATVRQNVPNFFIGGGYRLPIGERSSFNILLLYDIIQSSFSIYSNPVIEVGLGIGI